MLLGPLEMQCGKLEKTVKGHWKKRIDLKTLFRKNIFYKEVLFSALDGDTNIVIFIEL